VLNQDLGTVEHAVHARRPVHAPVAPGVEEVRRVLKELRGVMWLVASRLYGGGLRLQERLVRLRLLAITANDSQAWLSLSVTEDGSPGLPAMLISAGAGRNRRSDPRAHACNGCGPFGAVYSITAWADSVTGD
jgi:hypothetical protein